MPRLHGGLCKRGPLLTGEGTPRRPLLDRGHVHTPEQPPHGHRPNTPARHTSRPAERLPTAPARPPDASLGRATARGGSLGC